VVEKGDLQGPGYENYILQKAQTSKDDNRIKGRSDGWYPNHSFENKTTDWRPTCTCGHDDTVPQLVFDPFVGSGTTLMVARKLGRVGVGTDLSFPYLELAQERLGYKDLLEWEQGIVANNDGFHDLPLFEHETVPETAA
jgi:hypothetical protein